MEWSSTNQGKPKMPKRCQEIPESRGGKEEFFSSGFGGNISLVTPWFGTPSLQNCGGMNSLYFKLPNLWYFIIAVLESNIHS